MNVLWWMEQITRKLVLRCLKVSERERKKEDTTGEDIVVNRDIVSIEIGTKRFSQTEKRARNTIVTDRECDKLMWRKNSRRCRCRLS